jgi:hypothetical protein
MNGGKMCMNDKEQQKRGPRNNSTGLDKIEKSTQDQNLKEDHIM